MLVTTRPSTRLGYDRQTVARVRGEEELPPPHTQQVVTTHQTENTLVIDLPALADQFGLHAAIAVRWPA
jgi:hypothetical protein